MDHSVILENSDISEKKASEMEFNMSEHDNGIRESGQHKNIVMLSSQLDEISKPPVRARKLRKTMDNFSPPSKQLKSKADVLNTNMKETSEMANSDIAPSKRHRNYISCIPIMKLSTAQSCLIASDGSDSTNNCCSTQFASNVEGENVTWHVPIDQKQHIDPSISNTVHENKDGDTIGSDSELFSGNPTKLPGVVSTTEYGNSSGKIAGTNAKQGVISSMFSMADPGSEYTDISITDDQKPLITPYHDLVSESDPERTDFTVPRQTVEPSDILNAGNEEWTGSQHVTAMAKESASPNPGEHHNTIQLSTTENLEQMKSCEASEELNLCFQNVGREFGALRSEPVAIPKNSSMTDLSQSNIAIAPLEIFQPTRILNPENRRSANSHNLTAGAREPTPNREIYYSKGILPPKTIPTQIISHQAAEFHDTYSRNKESNDWRSKRMTTPESSSLTVPSQPNSRVIPRDIFQPVQTPISEDNRWVRSSATEGSGSASSIREHPYLTVSLPPESILAEAESRQTTGTLNVHKKKGNRRKYNKRGIGQIADLKLSSIGDSPKSKYFVVTHGISDPEFLMNTSENNRSASSQYSITEEQESASSVRGYHHSIGVLPTQTIHTDQTPKVLRVFQQKEGGTSGGPQRVAAPISYSMAKSSQFEFPIFPQEISQHYHRFHCENSTSNIPQNSTAMASPIGEHNYSSASLPSEMIPTQISLRQRANSPHVNNGNGNRRFDVSVSEQIGTPGAFSMVDSSKCNVPLMTQEILQPVPIPNTQSGAASGRNYTERGCGPAHSLGEHNYSILLFPNEITSTETSSHQTTKSLCIFPDREIGNSHKWKSYQRTTSIPSLMDRSYDIPTPLHFPNPAQGRVAHLQDSSFGQENPLFQEDPNIAVSLQPKIIPIQVSNLNYNTAFRAATRNDFLQENEESLRVQVPNYHNYLGQFPVPEIESVIKNPRPRSRKNKLVIPPSQTFSSLLPNSSCSSMDTGFPQPNREYFPSHAYTEELLSRNLHENRALIEQNHLSTPYFSDASLRSAHAMSSREVVLNPYFIDTLQNLDINHSKLGAALSYAPNIVAPNIFHDQTQGPSNISVDRKYSEFDHHYILHQGLMHPRFSNNTFYDELGSTNPMKDPKQSRKKRCDSKSRVPKKIKRGKTFPNLTKKGEPNERQISRTECQNNSKEVKSDTPLILKTYYFFTNRNKKFRPTYKLLGNELGSIEPTPTKLKVITDEHTKYLAIAEGSASTLESLDHVKSYQQQNKNAVVEKFGVISTNFTIINEIVQRFFGNGAAGVIEKNPLSSAEMKDVNEIPTNAMCHVAANENGSTSRSNRVSEIAGESIPSEERSEHIAPVFENSSNPLEANQDINLITLEKTDDRFQLILAVHQEPCEEGVCSQKDSVIDTLKKKFESNCTVSLHEVLKIYFMGEETRDELINSVTELLLPKK